MRHACPAMMPATNAQKINIANSALSFIIRNPFRAWSASQVDTSPLLKLIVYGSCRIKSRLFPRALPLRGGLPGKNL